MRCSEIHNHAVPRGMVRNGSLVKCLRGDIVSLFLDILVNVLAVSAFPQDVRRGGVGCGSGLARSAAFGCPDGQWLP